MRRRRGRGARRGRGRPLAPVGVLDVSNWRFSVAALAGASASARAVRAACPALASPQLVLLHETPELFLAEVVQVPASRPPHNAPPLPADAALATGVRRVPAEAARVRMVLLTELVHGAPALSPRVQELRVVRPVRDVPGAVRVLADLLAVGAVPLATVVSGAGMNRPGQEVRVVTGEDLLGLPGHRRGEDGHRVHPHRKAPAAVHGDLGVLGHRLRVLPGKLHEALTRLGDVRGRTPASAPGRGRGGAQEVPGDRNGGVGARGSLGEHVHIRRPLLDQKGRLRRGGGSALRPVSDRHTHPDARCPGGCTGEDQRLLAILATHVHGKDREAALPGDL